MNPNYGWYNGPWRGYWGSNWYSPLLWGGLGWGLGAYTAGWGYGYYNPYYVVTSPVYQVYNYSQPVPVTSYVVDEGTEVTTPVQVSSAFDNALGLFKAGEYAEAMPYFDTAIKDMPGDAVAHEVRALNLFALGQYQPAAAALNSLLTSAPGMDWTTMSGLYGNVEDYTAQLRNLEAYCKEHPNDAAAYFVLAYQYLVTGYQAEAADALRVVVANQPKDVTAKRMLDALTNPPSQNSTAAPETNQPLMVPAEATPTTPAGPQTDLVGVWRAKAGDTTIDLTVGDDAKFVWTATQPNQAPIKVTGDVSHAPDAVSFESPQQGAMAGSVKSISPDQWQFRLDGAPDSDPGLTFERVK